GSHGWRFKEADWTCLRGLLSLEPNFGIWWDLHADVNSVFVRHGGCAGNVHHRWGAVRVRHAGVSRSCRRVRRLRVIAVVRGIIVAAVVPAPIVARVKPGIVTQAETEAKEEIAAVVIIAIVIIATMVAAGVDSAGMSSTGMETAAA